MQNVDEASHYISLSLSWQETISKETKSFCTICLHLTVFRPSKTAMVSTLGNLNPAVSVNCTREKMIVLTVFECMIPI